MIGPDSHLGMGIKNVYRYEASGSRRIRRQIYHRAELPNVNGYLPARN